MQVSSTLKNHKPENAAKAIFAGGCFWCVEAEFRRLTGVLYTNCGYTGGATQNPSYEDICTGKTGHAEAVEVYFDENVISFKDLCERFLTLMHDPTQLNGQGVDIGTQYRSAIFYLSPLQHDIAADVIARLNSSGYFKKPIVTKLEKADIFWDAEQYHQQYYEAYERRFGTPHRNAYLKQLKWEKQR